MLVLQNINNTYRVVFNNFRTINDEVIPQQPQEIVHCERSKQVHMDANSGTSKRPGIRFAFIKLQPRFLCYKLITLYKGVCY